MKSLLVFIAGFLFVASTFAQGADISTLVKNDLGIYTLNGKVYTGSAFKKFENGNIGIIGQIKDGKMEGTWTWFYSNGEKKRESIYINNKKEGLTYYWHPNGIKAKEIMYRDDRNIDQKLWDENGNRKKNPSFDSWK